MKGDLDDLALAPWQYNVIEGYIDMLQVACLASGFAEGSLPLKDRFNGIKAQKAPEASRRIDLDSAPVKNGNLLGGD